MTPKKLKRTLKLDLLYNAEIPSYPQYEGILRFSVKKNGILR